MERITIYHITCNRAWNAWTTGEGWSLTPWPGDDAYYQGYDDGGADYLLPDGYHLGETALGEPAIYKGSETAPVGLVDSGGHPALGVTLNGLRLQRAE